MINSIRVRSFEAADHLACLEVFDSNVPTFFLPTEREAFSTFLSGLPGPYLVLEDGNGEIVGCGGFARNEEPGRVDLCWGMVRQEKHRHGLGQVLTEARIRAAAVDSSIREIALETSQLTSDFYERFGFRVVHREADALGPGLDRCAMRLTLNESGH